MPERAMSDRLLPTPDPRPLEGDGIWIEAAQLADSRAIAEVQVETWRAAYPGIVPDSFLAGLSVAKSEAGWRQALELGSPQLRVARKDGRVVGWVAFGRSRDDGASADTAEVWAIYVLPAFWAAGVGCRLWRAAQARLRIEGMRRVTLWALADNARAARFYVLAGFAAEAASLKTFELGGASLEEVRFVMLLEPAAADIGAAPLAAR